MNTDDYWERAYGPVDRDARHRLAVTGIVDIPMGFQLSGIFYYRSKYPWNAVYKEDTNLDGMPYDWVDQQRNSRRGYDEMYLNLRVSKFFDVGRIRIHPFAEIYNAFNRTNFAAVHPYIDDVELFGNPIAASPPRQFQIGIRLDW